MGKGNSFVEIEQVRTGSIGAPAPHEFHSLRSLLGKGTGPEHTLGSNADKVFDEFSAGFVSGKFSQEQADLVNWFEQKKLIDWGDGLSKIADFRKKAQSIEKALPPERYATTMGRALTTKATSSRAVTESRDR